MLGYGIIWSSNGNVQSCQGDVMFSLVEAGCGMVVVR